MQTFSAEKGRIKIEAKVIDIGDDLCIIISGGEGPHIGCVTLSVPRGSESSTGNTASTTSVICRTGHKDDEAARYISNMLSARLNKYVACICGIHVENITEAEIVITMKLMEELINKIIGGNA